MEYWYLQPVQENISDIYVSIIVYTFVEVFRLSKE